MARQRKEEAPLQEPIRENGRIQVRGRDGEILTRKRTASSDVFHIPPEIIPHGYSYQWNVMEVLGKTETASQLAMAENGWRPVPAGRHKGMFMPANYSDDGPILRDGFRLDERPIELTNEARAEEHEKARLQMRDSQEGLGLAMPSGFDRNNANLRRMERQGTSQSIGPAPDIARPRLPIDNS